MAVFCSSLTSWFPGMLLTYFLNNFEIVPVAPIITGINFIIIIIYIYPMMNMYYMSSTPHKMDNIECNILITVKHTSLFSTQISDL